MAMTSMRVNTQPALPSLVRTRLQSSIGVGAGGSVLDSGFSGSSISSLGTESSSQFSGGFGAGGVGGGGILGWDFSLPRLREARTGFGGATGEETWAACVLGVSVWLITSTLAPSGICQKLGEARFASVCMFSGSYADAAP